MKTSRPKQNGHHLEDIFEFIFFYESVLILIHFKQHFIWTNRGIAEDQEYTTLWFCLNHMINKYAFALYTLVIVGRNRFYLALYGADCNTYLSLFGAIINHWQANDSWAKTGKNSETVANSTSGTHLITWLNFIPSMDK